MAVVNLTSQKFGRLTVIKKSHSAKGRAWWNCICECGETTTVSTNDLRRLKTKSCGCLRRETTSKSFKTHGESYSSEYKIWTGMLRRCEKPNVKAFKHYGGRGISVCERWHQFENFLADMGKRPSPKFSLERQDVNGNYSPENCKWATSATQARNRRSTWLLTFNNKTQSALDWATELGFLPGTIQKRKRLGWCDECTLSAELKSKCIHKVKNGN